MQRSVLDPFIPSGKDFALARPFFEGAALVLEAFDDAHGSWDHLRGRREEHLLDPAGECWHFGQR